MTSVEFPNSITSIGEAVFQGCYALSSPVYNSTIFACLPTSHTGEYKIPDGITTIASYAFSGCSGLTSVNIPNSTVSIGKWAFDHCLSLASVIVDVENPDDITLGYNAFYYIPKGTCTLYVPRGSKALYEAADQWKEFTNIQEFNPDITIVDANPYNRTEEVEEVTVHYTRTFTTDAWQALYVPFSMKYEEWADKADVAYINNVHQWDDDKDGKIDRTVLEFITKTSGCIEANTPYVIRPKQLGEVTFTAENTVLKAAPATDGFVDCRSTTTEYTIYGTYQEKTDMHTKGYYAMWEGDFMQAESDAVTLAPFRIYLDIKSRTGAGVSHKPHKVQVMVDGETTDIDEMLDAECIMQNDATYNLAGQKVSGSYKGLVIKNGRKYINK